MLTHDDSFVRKLCLLGWFATPEDRSIEVLTTKIERLLTINVKRLRDDEATLRARFEQLAGQLRDSNTLWAPSPEESATRLAQDALCSYWTFAREKARAASVAVPEHGSAWTHLRSDDPELRNAALQAVSLFTFADKTSGGKRALVAMTSVLRKSAHNTARRNGYRDRAGSTKFESAVKKIIDAERVKIHAAVNRLFVVCAASDKVRIELAGIAGVGRVRRTAQGPESRTPSDLTVQLRFTVELFDGVSHTEIVDFPTNIKGVDLGTKQFNTGGAAMFQQAMLARTQKVTRVNDLRAEITRTVDGDLPIPDSNYLFWVFDKGAPGDPVISTAKVVPLLGAVPGRHLKYNEQQSFPHLQVIPDAAGATVSLPATAGEARKALYDWLRSEFLAATDAARASFGITPESEARLRNQLELH